MVGIYLSLFTANKHLLIGEIVLGVSTNTSLTRSSNTFSASTIIIKKESMRLCIYSATEALHPRSVALMRSAGIRTNSRKRWARLLQKLITLTKWKQDGSSVYVKIHLVTDQGIKTFSSEESTKMSGVNPNHNLQDLFESIEKGGFPSWTVYVQVMTAEEAEKYRWNIFDMTKIWPHADYPLRQFGKLTLDQVVSRTPQSPLLKVTDRN